MFIYKNFLHFTFSLVLIIFSCFSYAAQTESSEFETRIQGTIKWYNNEKGYGFIRPNGSSMDIFVHSSGLNPNINFPLLKGMKVSYVKYLGPKGAMALNVDAMFKKKGKFIIQY